MTDNVEKYPPIPEERLKKYQDLWLNSRSSDGIEPDVARHLARVKALHGVGIEFLSGLNKEYLGAFMAPFSREVEDADIAVVGLPFEKSAPMNASHKFGPKMIRELSKNFMGTTEPRPDGKFDIPFDWARIIDYGNVDTYGQYNLSDEVETAISHFEKIVGEAGCSPFTLGGDHTVSYVPINALGKRWGPLGCIHFDGHYDLVTYADFPYPYHSGNQFTNNMQQGYLDPERMITMGVRGRMTALVGGHAKNFGVTVKYADQCRHTPPKEMAEEIIAVVGDGPTYISFDVDGLDPIYNSASSAVEPFGLDANWCWDVLWHVRKSGKVNLVGADVVEYAPYLDASNTFGYVAAGIAWKILCWLADEERRRNGEERPTVWPQAFGNVTL